MDRYNINFKPPADLGLLKTLCRPLSTEEVVETHHTTIILTLSQKEKNSYTKCTQLAVFDFSNVTLSTPRPCFLHLFNCTSPRRLSIVSSFSTACSPQCCPVFFGSFKVVCFPQICLGESPRCSALNLLGVWLGYD